MSAFEITLVLILTALLVVPFWLAYRLSRRYGAVLFWNPMLLPTGAMAYYFVFGPCSILALGLDGVMYSFDARADYWRAWLCGILGFGSMLFGFWLGALRGRRFLVEERFRCRESRLSIVGWCALLLSLVGVVSNLRGVFDSLAAFSAYLMQLLNFLLIVIIVLYWKFRKRLGLALALCAPLYLVWCAFMIRAAFRGPLIFGTAGLYFAYHLIERRRPNVALAAVSSVGVIFFCGVVVLSRSYFQGLDLSRIEGVSWQGVFMAGFGDSCIFGALGAIIAYVPACAPFSYFEMFTTTLLFPIPRMLYPGKSTPEYLYYVNDAIGASATRETQGMAVPNYGEFYMAFGWWGVILLSIVLGWLAAQMWRWYLARQRNPAAIFAYGAFCGCMTLYIHRGYLPMAMMSFAFTVLPLFLLSGWLEQRKPLGRL